MSHTPGPWTVEEEWYSDAFPVVDARGFQIVEAQDMPILLGYTERLGIGHWAEKPGEAYLELDSDEVLANARLIAAAPELLAALKPFAEEPISDDAYCHRGVVPKGECIRCSRIIAARAAIQKAKGEA